MRLQYRPESDSLSVVPTEAPDADAPAPAIVLEFDDEGRLVNLDLQHAAAWSISRALGPRSFRIGLLPPEPSPDEAERAVYAG